MSRVSDHAPMFNVLVVSLVVILALVHRINGVDERLKCEQHSKTIRDLNLHTYLTKYPQTDAKLSICRSKHSCCTPSMEQTLKVHSTETLVKQVNKALSPLRDAGVQISTRFREYQHESLRILKSKLISHLRSMYAEVTLLEATYLVEPLLKVIGHRGHVSASDTRHRVRSASATFQRRLFAYSFRHGIADLSRSRRGDTKESRDTADREDRELDACVRGIHDELDPFAASGDRISRRLEEAAHRAHRLARLAAVSGHLFDRLTSDWTPSESCTRAVTRAYGCTGCERVEPARVCGAVCENVARGCTVGFRQLVPSFETYVGQFLAEVKSAKGARRIDMLHHHLALDIRVAIEYSESFSKHIFQQVKSRCGPTSMRYAPIAVTRSPIPSHVTPKSHTRLLHSVRSLVAARGVLRSLPATLCKQTRTKRHHCWDGHRVVRSYDKQVPKADVKSQVLHNPEVDVSDHVVFRLLYDELAHVVKNNKGMSGKHRKRSAQTAPVETMSEASGLGIDDDDGESSASGSGDDSSTVSPPDSRETSDGFYIVDTNTKKPTEGSTSVRYGPNSALVYITCVLITTWSILLVR